MIAMLLMVVLGFIFLRWTFNLFFGKGTTDYLVALILHDIFLLPFRFIKYLFK